jgi:hypothetical protein
MRQARQCRRHRAGRATYKSDVSVWLLWSASASAAPPASQILLYRRLQRERKVRDASGETGPPAQRWAHDLLVVLKAAAREEGQGCVVATQGRRQEAWRETYSSVVSSRSAFASVSVYIPRRSSSSTTPAILPFLVLWFLSCFC